MILVLSKDLGSAIIYFVVYISMLYAATRNVVYFLAGFAGGGIASVAGYKLFRHVRVRVTAFLDPMGTITNEGYQIAQSLFAIGTGGWLGMGLGEGAPNNIPVVAADFVFAAICEELGVVFGMCLILLCLSCFVMFMNISMKFEDPFFKLVALGLSVAYIFQVFLTIGGVIKFIPLTGVTLPFVSYGGTSVAVTFCVFAVIQGLYIAKGRDNKKPYVPTPDDFKTENLNIVDLESELNDNV
jgi:cell division protein FtsW (lipid II flippase)